MKNFEDFLAPFVDVKQYAEQQKLLKIEKNDILWKKLCSIRKVMKPVGRYYPHPKRFNHCPNCEMKLIKTKVRVCGTWWHNAHIYECPKCGYVYAHEHCTCGPTGWE